MEGSSTFKPQSFSGLELANAVLKSKTENIDLESLKQLVHLRYSRVTGIEVDDDGWPVGYTYYTEGEKLPSDSHRYPVSREDVLVAGANQSIVEPKYLRTWLHLNPQYKDLLCVILMSANAIGAKIYYDREMQKWVKRPSHAPIDEDTLQSLPHYGTTSDELCVMDQLTTGRTINEIAEVVKRNRFYFDETIHEAWVMALMSDMTSGDAHEAISCVFKSIKMLRHGLEQHYPKISVFNCISLTSDNAFSISSHSGSTTASPERKKRKTHSACADSDSNKNETCGNASCSEKDELGFENVKGKVEKIFPWPSHNRRYVDLVVGCHEEEHDIGKYLFLVDVLSHGKTWLQAQCQFCKELIHVLQAQSEVFGMLFGTHSIILYRAKRVETQTVVIVQKLYSLTQYRSGDISASSRYFEVSAFQEMLMDIFTCLLYGADNITA